MTAVQVCVAGLCGSVIGMGKEAVLGLAWVGLGGMSVLLVVGTALSAG